MEKLKRPIPRLWFLPYILNFYIHVYLTLSIDASIQIIAFLPDLITYVNLTLERVRRLRQTQQNESRNKTCWRYKY